MTNFINKKQNVRTAILMDEIDGVSGNQDRGGVQALIQILKKTLVPIVCIANDGMNKKIQSLRNYVYELKFTKPNLEDVLKRVKVIAEAESIKIDRAAIVEAVERSGHDIRQVINFLQMNSTTSRTLTMNEYSKKGKRSMKDQQKMMTPQQGVAQLLTKKNFNQMSFAQKLNLFFLDYDLTPLLVQENYLGSMMN